MNILQKTSLKLDAYNNKAQILEFNFCWLLPRLILQLIIVTNILNIKWIYTFLINRHFSSSFTLGGKLNSNEFKNLTDSSLLYQKTIKIAPTK